MSLSFGRLARRGLRETVAEAIREGDGKTDFRAAICRFEDELFTVFPAGHRVMNLRAAEELIADIFMPMVCPLPRLVIVAGFSDPRVGGYADIARHRIAIERGHLYRFLVLHEAAHLIVPQDRRHGPGFTFVLQLLYRSFLAIPEDAMRRLLLKHALPSLTGMRPALAA
jgi:hypothetical protein